MRPAQPVSRVKAPPDVTLRQETLQAPDGQRYSVSELHGQLLRFERELREAGLAANSVKTYVDRSRRFLKWLEDDYRSG
jgi:hypothetical protein